MTLNLTDEEEKALHVLADEKMLSKTQVMRQALRLYQKVHILTRSGATIYLQRANGDTPRKLELLV